MHPNPNPEKPPVEIRCPRCRGGDIVPSLPRGFWDAVMTELRRVPRHCRACGKRFYVLERDLGISADEE